MENRFILDIYIKEGVYKGYDDDNNLIFVIESTSPENNAYYQSTKELVFGYNILATIVTEIEFSKNVHILKCLSKDKMHLDNFELLVSTYISHDNYGDYKKISGLFSTFLSMFSKETERSFSEIEGFFCELYFIYYIESKGVSIIDAWQKIDKMKFDFYLDEISVIDIKSTSSEQRIHHFMHEQLASDLYDIFIVSFLTRLSNCGLSIIDLVIKIRSELSVPLSAQNAIEKFITNTKNKEDLYNIKFDLVYITNQMKFYKAADIPKFNGKQPNGISKTEYDSDLSCSNPSDINEFISWIKSKNLKIN